MPSAMPDYVSKQHVYCTTDHSTTGQHKEVLEIPIPSDHEYRAHSVGVSTQAGPSGYEVRLRRRSSDQKVVGVICEIWVRLDGGIGSGRSWIGVELYVTIHAPESTLALKGTVVGDVEAKQEFA
jgi:hypothetical protein